MHVAHDKWLVPVAAQPHETIDATRVKQILEQSDLGGDLVYFAGDTPAIILRVVAAARTEQKAYYRVLAWVKDTLGSRWTVQVCSSKQ